MNLAQGSSKDALQEKWAEEQVRLQCAETLKMPLPIILAAVILSYGAWGLSPAAVSVGWVLAMVGAQAARAYYSRQFFARKLSAVSMGKYLSNFSLINGLLTGIGFAYFAQWYRLEWQAIATTTIISLLAGAIPATAIHFIRYVYYGAPVTLGLVFGWTVFGKIEPSTFDFAMAGGSALFFYICASYVKDAQASAFMTFATRFENTQLLEELKLKQAEIEKERDFALKANLAKSRFLASASHDLRQPLQTISLYNAALGLQNNSPKSQELISREAVAITSLASLLNALLDVSQLDTENVRVNKTKLNLSEFFSKFTLEFESLAINRGLRFDCFCTPDLTVFTDIILFERVIRNLLDNAFKHGGKTYVSLSAKPIESGMVEIAVCDDGNGIPSHEADLIFEEFYQINNEERDRVKGIGLGLAIVRRLCQLFDAKCLLDSNENKTCFKVQVQRSTDRDKPVVDAAVAGPDRLLLQGAKMLIFDDEISVRDSMTALLTAFGCDVHSTGSAAEAAAYLKQNTYLVLLADYRLREGLDGISFIQNHRDLLKNTATILITGDANPTINQLAEDAGILVVRKPVSASDLRRLLEDIATP